MKGLTLGYVVRRFGLFLLTIWIAATIIFIVPRLAPGDPIAAMVARLQQQAGRVENSAQIIEAWRERFGLNDPLPVQYIRYLGNILSLDFGYSLFGFPTTVNFMIGRALPWTIGLLSVAVILSFLIGNVGGALLAWARTPRLIKFFIPMTMVFTSVPSLLVGIFLVYILAFNVKLFPYSGSYGRGVEEGFTLEFFGSVIYHGILPALAIILVSFGYWALGMRGMMVTTEGEDYMVLAEAKGLNPWRVLTRYSIRNAILPQVTALALSMGTLVTGSVLVEYVFNYRGMGGLLYTGIINQDYTVIQGTVFVLILSSATAVLIIDLLYPLIDPRISYQGR